jgi:hypothetical protein
MSPGQGPPSMEFLRCERKVPGIQPYVVRGLGLLLVAAEDGQDGFGSAHDPCTTASGVRTHRAKA